jgi:hypothetical protein
MASKAELLAQAQQAEENAAEFDNQEMRSSWLDIAEFFRDLARSSEAKEQAAAKALPK